MIVTDEMVLAALNGSDAKERELDGLSALTTERTLAEWGEHSVRRMRNGLEAALSVAPLQGDADEREAFATQFRQCLGQEIYSCSRDHSAWVHGTMGLDDFSLAGDDDEFIDSLVDIALSRAAAPEEEDPFKVAEDLYTLRGGVALQDEHAGVIIDSVGNFIARTHGKPQSLAAVLSLISAEISADAGPVPERGEG